MIWWIVILATIVAALAYAYWEHRRQSRHLLGLFVELTATNGGTIKSATILALPQLYFELDGNRYFVGAMANAGSLVSGSANRPGFNGPFTFANLELEYDTDQDLNIQRTDRLDRSASRLINSVTDGYTATSGDTAFDGAFRIRSDDQAFVHRVLNAALRHKLLASPQQRLEVAVTGTKISIHIDDYAKTVEDLEEMVEIATLVAENCAAS